MISLNNIDFMLNMKAIGFYPSNPFINILNPIPIALSKAKSAIGIETPINTGDYINAAKVT